MEALEARYREFLPSGLSGLCSLPLDYSLFNFEPWRKSPRLPRSTPASPSPFTIPRVSLRVGGSDGGSVNGMLSRSHSKPDLVPSPSSRR